MSDLHSYLREYIEKLETLLKQCDTGNDACLLQAAYRLWGEEDPRYLVLVEFQNALESGANLTPKRSELHLTPPPPSGLGRKESNFVQERQKSVDRRSSRRYGPRVGSSHTSPIQPVPKSKESDFEQEEQKAKGQIKNDKPVNRR